MAVSFATLNQRFNKVSNEIQAFLDGQGSDLLDIPDWKQVQNKETYYTIYREAILKERVMSGYLIDLGHIRVMLSELRQSFPKDSSIPSTLKLQYREQLERWTELAKELYNAIEPLKESTANTIRFLSSIQYIISSNRLNPTEI